MQKYTVLPIVAIFLIAMSSGDKLWSFAYLLKIIPAFTLMIISVILLTINLRKRNTKQKQNN